eukprot:11640872-Heterocapsa_arctica.AAC.1
MWEQKIDVIYEFGEPNRSDSTVEVVFYLPGSDITKSETRGGDNLTEHYDHGNDLYVFKSTPSSTTSLAERVGGADGGGELAEG